MAQMWSLQAHGGVGGSSPRRRAAPNHQWVGGSLGRVVFFLICCETMCRWHSRPAGRNRGTRDAKAGFLILNCFPCQGTNVPCFKIIIIKPGRGSRESKILLWVSVRWLKRCCGWRRAACPTPQADAHIAGAVFGGWVSSPRVTAGSETCVWGRAVIQKGENEFPLTLHPKE